jgi:hypothetical protein
MVLMLVALAFFFALDAVLARLLTNDDRKPPPPAAPEAPAAV